VLSAVSSTAPRSRNRAPAISTSMTPAGELRSVEGPTRTVGWTLDGAPASPITHTGNNVAALGADIVTSMRVCGAHLRRGHVSVDTPETGRLPQLPCGMLCLEVL
jgi:hypothetical protein